MIEYFPYHRKLLKKKEVRELLNHFDPAPFHRGTMSGGDNETTREIKTNNGWFEDQYANEKIIYEPWIEMMGSGGEP